MTGEYLFQASQSARTEYGYYNENSSNTFEPRMNATLTRKGQVTLPKKYRDYLGVQSGEQVAFSLNPDGEVVVRAARPSTRLDKDAQRFAVTRGSLRTGKPTDALMALLRGYDQDAIDPGFQ